MDKEVLIRFAPVILVVFITFFQYNLFVTPRELEVVHREVLETVSEKYLTKSESNALKEQISELQNKVDKIYNLLISRKE